MHCSVKLVRSIVAISLKEHRLVSIQTTLYQRQIYKNGETVIRINKEKEICGPNEYLHYASVAIV